ncbi:MAG: hypothetical protein ACLS59_06865 [Clostridia bacterium]
MKISKEQKEAIEYLEKYTKWETYGERNLEKDIITVLGLLKETQIKNETLEEKIEKQEDIIKNALYIINKDEKEKIDETWLYNFDKCAILRGDNK